MATFVIGDIHGGYRALLQCLERSNFNKEVDELISLGDICDGWSETYECVEELLTIPNRICIRGNHDVWFNNFIKTGMHEWTHGAQATRASYERRDMIIPQSHENFFSTQYNYYIDQSNCCFVHGGFNRHLPISVQDEFIYYWDRDLWLQALSFASMKDSKYKFKMVDNFTEVYIGHTTTGLWGKDIPMHAANIWNLDTGAGFEGKLTIMNVDTKEYWQSDLVQELYPDEIGRN